ncbi:pilus assembly protein TadG-related protein [Pseudomonas protegens]|uniref:pilus assembly protein TadG-related protein n=1 Tax=Pseudomonas protegens TaxID=380021 RepID=UPI0029372340|nr:pilus assembly protein TadG-related protein [Pseudomonas protegens]WOE81736.1 pilus assembly protein TadG-related protein [Pseudomonas protegens]
MMNARIRQPRTAFVTHQRGAMIVLVVIALASILLLGALALDGSHMLLNKTRLQNAVDAAALSGAKTLSMVQGATGAASLAQTAALNTLTLNANAMGNQELATAIGSNLAGFAKVELASSVYGPFSFPGPAKAGYVRITVANYPLTSFFWGVFQALDNGSAASKAVAAVATAGPSPTSPCHLTPLLVCGNPAQNNPATGMFWGYKFGDVQLLKTAANNNSAIGPGHFQLLDFVGGGNAVRQALAGGINQCSSVGSSVRTKPGSTIGSSAQGLNTRFNQYSGGLSALDYPPDLVIAVNAQSLTYSGTPGQIQYNGQTVTSSNGNLSTPSGVLYGYNNWQQASAACVAGAGGGCQARGAFERRILKVVIGDCTGSNDGTSSIPVLGFGCYFLLQPQTQQGNSAQIFGQFVRACEGDNVPGAKPANNSGPQIIQLYKTYIDNNQTPSTDS